MTAETKETTAKKHKFTKKTISKVNKVLKLMEESEDYMVIACAKARLSTSALAEWYNASAANYERYMKAGLPVADALIKTEHKVAMGYEFIERHNERNVVGEDDKGNPILGRGSKVRQITKHIQPNQRALEFLITNTLRKDFRVPAKIELQIDPESAKLMVEEILLGKPADTVGLNKGPVDAVAPGAE